MWILRCSVGEQDERPSTFTTCHGVSDSSDEHVESPESVFPQSPTRAESSLHSMDGVSCDFAFAPLRNTPAPTKDWKGPGMFKMPATPAPRDEPIRSVPCACFGGKPSCFFHVQWSSLSRSLTTCARGLNTSFDLRSQAQHDCCRHRTVCLKL